MYICLFLIKIIQLLLLGIIPRGTLKIYFEKLPQSLNDIKLMYIIETIQIHVISVERQFEVFNFSGIFENLNISETAYD